MTGLYNTRIKHWPRLLSENGPSYVSSELADWLEEHGIEHTRGKHVTPQTQGKIERWHRSLRNQILLENHYLPRELKSRINELINY